MRITFLEHARSSHPIRSQALGSMGWILLAVAAALFVWLIAVPILDTSLVVKFGAAPSQTVTPALIAVVVTVSGLVAWALLSMLNRLAKGGQTVWRIVAAVVLAFSLSGPVFGGTMPATKVTLILMHLIVAAVLVAGLPAAGTTRAISAES